MSAPNKQPPKGKPAQPQKPPAAVIIKAEPGVVAASSSATSASANAAPKRTFVPNLALKREKKDNESEKQADGEPNRQQNTRRPPQPNVGRGRRPANVIQSKSIFEAGPAESQKKYGNKDMGTIDRVVGTIDRTNFDGPNIGSEAKQGDKHNLKAKSEYYTPDEILLDDSIKEEEGNYVKLESIKENKGNILKRSKSMDDIDTMRNAFLTENNEENEDLYLFQMVDCLKLNEIPDGKIGKLKIYKSGKVELCMGNNIKLDVSLASDASFLQDVINVQVDETTESGTMTCIGHVKNKILCTPQFD